MLCYVMLCYVMLCYVMLCYVTLYIVMTKKHNDLQTQYERTNIGFRLGFLCSKTVHFMKNAIIKNAYCNA